MTNGTDLSLLQAKRLLDMANASTIAEAERQRLIAKAKAKYLPSHLNRDLATEWELVKTGLAIMFCLVAAFILMVPWAQRLWILLIFMAMSCAFTCVHVALTFAFLHPNRAESWAFKSWLDFSTVCMPFRFIVDLVVRKRLSKRASSYGVPFQWKNDEATQEELLRIKKTPAGELVRDWAVAEIERIRTDTLGPDSEMAKAEEGLAELLSQAECMRLQILHRLKKATGDRIPPLEQGMELAKKRESNLRKALSQHREVVSRARAALDECLSQAQGLDENMADAELLKRLEEQAADDERQIALSELVMEQAVSNLRGRTMSIVTVLAQLEPNRVIGGNQTRVAEEEHEAYLERIETAAEKLAAI